MRSERQLHLTRVDLSKNSVSGCHNLDLNPVKKNELPISDGNRSSAWEVIFFFEAGLPGSLQQTKGVSLNLLDK